MKYIYDNVITSSTLNNPGSIPDICESICIFFPIYMEHLDHFKICFLIVQSRK